MNRTCWEKRRDQLASQVLLNPFFTREEGMTYQEDVRKLDKAFIKLLSATGFIKLVKGILDRLVKVLK